ncbi:MAG: VTT domain-containing protein [Patescibacteria group bacterium]
MSVTSELIRNIGALSYLEIFGISIISNVIVPVPEEAVLLILGYLAGTQNINGFILAPIVFLGLLLSDIVMYFLSKRGAKVVNFFYQKVFASRLEGKTEWIGGHINKIIFFSRFLVQLRFLGPFFAGHLRIPFKKFLIYDFLALIIYVPMYLFIGWYFHSRVEFIIDGIGTIRNIIIIVVALGMLLATYKFLYKFFMGEKFLGIKKLVKSEEIK